jgi:hypothetical protein
MNIETAKKELEAKYLPLKGVFGIAIVGCATCKGQYIEISMDTHNRELLSKIPSKFNGFRIEKVHQTTPIQAQNNDQYYAPVYQYPYVYAGYYQYPYWGGGGWWRGGGGRPHGGGHHGGGRR